MPIEFACSNCGKRLRAQETSAGKRVRCAGCQTVLQVPGASPTPGPSAPPPSAVAGQWYVKADDGQTYGPVSKQELDSWVAEGRVTAETQILREGAAQWQWATDVYPQLAVAPQPGAQPGGQQNSFDFGQAEAKPSNPFDFAAEDNSPTARVTGGRSGGYRSGGGRSHGRRRPQSGAVTAVAVVNFIIGALQLMCGALMVVLGDAVSRFFGGAGAEVGGEPGEVLEAGGAIVGGIIIGFGIAGVIFGAFVILAGVGVVQRAEWGRIMTLILGGLSGVLGLLCIANMGRMAMVNGGQIAAVLMYGGYCAMVFTILLNRQNAAEFR